jgi:hypothetical protein
MLFKRIIPIVLERYAICVARAHHTHCARALVLSCVCLMLTPVTSLTTPMTPLFIFYATTNCHNFLVLPCPSLDAIVTSSLSVNMSMHEVLLSSRSPLLKHISFPST